MSSGSRALARARSRAALLAAIAALALVGSFLCTGAVSFLHSSAIAGTRTILTNTPARDAALQLDTQLTQDATAQNEAADRLLTARVAALHTTVSRTLRTAALPFDQSPARPDSTGRTIILGSDAQLRQHARIVEGSWAPSAQDADAPEQGAPPQGAPQPGVLQARAADALGITAGDLLLVGAPGQQRQVLVTGTWLPNDPAAARWFGDPAVISGFDGTASGVLMVDEPWLATLPAAPHVRWTMTPDTSRFLPEDVPALGAALSRIGERLDNDAPISGDTLLAHGNLAATLTNLGQSQAAARAIATVPIVLTATIAFLALIQLARLLSATRRQETALLRARGSSPGALAALASAEAAAVIIPAAALGALAA
ncbi:MAG TPA: hypothetical protein VLZ78_05015, partial [Terrimesophilobacter sp.]|nr:hypothetical protein [Terrimesophilobacter sp.]